MIAKVASKIQNIEFAYSLARAQVKAFIEL